MTAEQQTTSLSIASNVGLIYSTSQINSCPDIGADDKQDSLFMCAPPHSTTHKIKNMHIYDHSRGPELIFCNSENRMFTLNTETEHQKVRTPTGAVCSPIMWCKFWGLQHRVKGLSRLRPIGAELGSIEQPGAMDVQEVSQRHENARLIDLYDSSTMLPMWVCVVVISGFGTHCANPIAVKMPLVKDQQKTFCVVLQYSKIQISFVCNWPGTHYLSL